ncbi:MAG: branched-chain amino acid ABC transporter permease [Streptosporangiales bacterium]
MSDERDTAAPSTATEREVSPRRRLGRGPRFALLALGICVVFIVPALGVGSYGIYLWSLALVYLLPAAGLNLMLGYAGQISLAQGAFLGVGAYTVAVTAPDWPFWLSLPLGTAIGFVLGILLGLPALRVRHHYLAMVTLAANQVFVLFVTNQKFTGGALGILSIERPKALSSDLGYHVLITLIGAGAMLLLFWVITSPWGRAFKGIRENEQRAAAVGVSLRAYKLLAFAIGSALAALGGALLAPLLGFVDPASFSLTVSLQFLLIVVLGGRGRFEAAFLGTIVIVVLPEVFRATQGLLPFLFALATLLIVMFLPGGLTGGFDAVWRKLTRREPPTLSGQSEGS